MLQYIFVYVKGHEMYDVMILLIDHIADYSDLMIPDDVDVLL